MKQKILEKLFSDQTLTSEEILYVSTNLNDGGEVIPYDHTAESIFESCNINKKEIDSQKKEIEREVVELPDTGSVSEIIELIERRAMASPQFFRFLITSSVKNAGGFRAFGIGDESPEVRSIGFKLTDNGLERIDDDEMEDKLKRSGKVSESDKERIASILEKLLKNFGKKDK